MSDTSTSEGEMRNDWQKVDAYLLGFVDEVRVSGDTFQITLKEIGEIADHIERLMTRVARLEEENDILKRGGV